MGLYDRDYSREEDDWGYSEYGSRPRAVQSMTVALIIVNVAVYLLDALSSNDHSLMNAIALQHDALVKPWLWWQFLTAAFAHSTLGVNHLLGNMLGLYIFGRDVEGKLGKTEFLRFYLLAAVLANLVWGVVHYLFSPAGTLAGASGAVTAVMVVYVCFFPRNTLLLFMVWPVPAWAAVALFLGFDILGAFRPQPLNAPQVAHDVHLAGAAFAFAYWKLHWSLGTVMPTKWIGNIKRWLNRPRLKIHDPEPTYENLDAEADRVLAKLSEHGDASLTPAERRVLEDYSRRMRQKLR